MATVMGTRGGEAAFSSAGRIIFRPGRQPFAPMEQLRIWNEGAAVDDLPSPTPSPADRFVEETHELARDYVTYIVEGTSTKAGSEAAKTLRRVGDEVVNRHQTVFKAMSHRLQLCDPSMSAAEKFVKIADEVSDDGQENWGRIVSLFVLGGTLARNDAKSEGARDVENIITTVGSFIATRKRAFIDANGGWAGFVKFFDNGSTENAKVLKGLLCAGAIGFVAYAATQ